MLPLDHYSGLPKCSQWDKETFYQENTGFLSNSGHKTATAIDKYYDGLLLLFFLS